MTTPSTRSRPDLESATSVDRAGGDNLLADFLSADAAAYRALAEQGGGRSSVDDELGLSMGDAGSPCYFGNVAHVTRPLDDGTAVEAVARLRRFYGAGAGGPYLVFTPWSLGDLGDQGFVLAGHPPLMVRPPGPNELDAGRTRIVTVRTAGEVADFDRTLTEAYPAEALQPYGTKERLFTDGILTTPWRLFTAYAGDRPVATAAAYVTDHVVAIEAVSTQPTFRGRGLGSLVTAAAVDAASDRPAALLSSDAGRPVYERHGFVAVLRFTLWIGVR